MKTLPINLIVVLAGLASADTKFETLRGISTTTHEVSPFPVRSRQTLMDGREPSSEEQVQIFEGYRLHWTATLPDPRPHGENSGSAMLTLRVWDPISKHFPGWNPPIVEIISDTVRLSCQELSEVGWAVDIWTASHSGSFLYVQTKHRHRFAQGENVYELNPKSLKLEHKGIYFSKEDLIRENKEMREALEQLSKPNGEQAVPSDGHKPSSHVPSDDPTAPADAH